MFLSILPIPIFLPPPQETVLGSFQGVIPSCSDSWSHGRMELATSRPDMCSESSCASPGLTRAQSPAVPLLDSVPSAKLPAHAVGGVRGGLEPRTESESLGQGGYNPARETWSQFCETRILLNDIWSGCKEIS